MSRRKSRKDRASSRAHPTAGASPAAATSSQGEPKTAEQALGAGPSPVDPPARLALDPGPPPVANVELPPLAEAVTDRSEARSPQIELPIPPLADPEPPLVLSDRPRSSSRPEYSSIRPEPRPGDPRPSELPSQLPAMPPIDANTAFTGVLLRQIRESQGKTIKTISQTTRVGTGSLLAVEAERFDDLPDARIYVRGFVRCLAQELGLDPDQVAQTYLRRWDDWFEAKKAQKKLPTSRRQT